MDSALFNLHKLVCCGSVLSLLFVQEKSKVTKDGWASREMGETEGQLVTAKALHTKNKTSV